MTIDLISIGIVAEDGRELYLQNHTADFTKGDDWMYRNVYPHLMHFDMHGHRACQQVQGSGLSSGIPRGDGRCKAPACPWRHQMDLKKAVLTFCDPDVYGKPEFWGYYADYDWVVFCQLFGRMIDLPKGFPMYCRDLKQWADMVGNPQLPKQDSTEHHALADARWNRQVWEFLNGLGALEEKAAECDRVAEGEATE